MESQIDSTPGATALNPNVSTHLIFYYYLFLFPDVELNEAVEMEVQKPGKVQF